MQKPCPKTENRAQEYIAVNLGDVPKEENQLNIQTYKYTIRHYENIWTESCRLTMYH